MLSEKVLRTEMKQQTTMTNWRKNLAEDDGCVYSKPTKRITCANRNGKIESIIVAGNQRKFDSEVCSSIARLEVGLSYGENIKKSVMRIQVRLRRQFQYDSAVETGKELIACSRCPRSTNKVNEVGEAERRTAGF